MDKEFWKRRYQGIWKAGNKREELFQKNLEGWGYAAKSFGFETLSKDYNPEAPEEKGKPDFYIDYFDKKIYFEVTGTDSPKTSEDDPIWLRPDKVEYAEKHGLITYCVHILTAKNLIRFLDMARINTKNIIHPVIRGTRETYIEVQASECISLVKFEQMLKDKEI